MMMMIDTITDKAEWMNKIQDQDIREKWSEELREAKIDISDSMIKRVSCCLIQILSQNGQLAGGERRSNVNVIRSLTNFSIMPPP